MRGIMTDGTRHVITNSCADSWRGEIKYGKIEKRRHFSSIEKKRGKQKWLAVFAAPLSSGFAPIPIQLVRKKFDV
jgi:hypothetical protein